MGIYGLCNRKPNLGPTSGSDPESLEFRDRVSKVDEFIPCHPPAWWDASRLHVALASHRSPALKVRTHSDPKVQYNGGTRNHGL